MKMSHVCRKKSVFFPESLSGVMRGVSCSSHTEADHTEDTHRMVCVCVCGGSVCVCVCVRVGVMHSRGAQGKPHSPES